MTVASGNSEWFAVRVRPRSEKKVANMLRYKGYEDFVPLYRSARLWSDRVKELDLPLFPGYVFCRFKPQYKLPVLTTPGVLAIVGFGGEPVAVDDAEISNLRIVARSGRPACPFAFVQIGKPVRVERGPLRGAEGLLIGAKRLRLVVSVKLLQRSIALDVDGDCVAPIEEPAKAGSSQFGAGAARVRRAR